MAEYDVYDYGILQVGAHQRKINDTNWQSMDSAPRDGTWIEIKNTYGVAPWYSIARWTTEGLAWSHEGQVPFTHDKPQWVQQNGNGFGSEQSLFWRPYCGDTANYVDPTGGAQDSPAYWRGAVADKYGLPLDAFEEETKRNTQKDKPSVVQKLKNLLK